MQQGNPAPGRVVAGRYAVVGELGRGGMGTVWRAQDQVIGRQVALKELRIPPGLSRMEHDNFVQRVLREARTAGALNDPAIVTVHDVVPEGGAMFIVMELIEADNLGDIVARSGPLAASRVSDIGLQVLSALDTAHAAGIVHRDIKPSNIMLLPGDRVKLTDFGIAQGADDPSLTATGGIMGSPGYMAPELFQGRPPSPSTDLWSLGATLFHVAEGRAPFERGNTAATLHAILYEEPHLNFVRGPLANAIMGLLVQQTEHRLTAAGLRELLTAGMSTRAVPAPSPSEASTEVMPRIDDRTAVVDRRSSSTRWEDDQDWEPAPRRNRRKAIWLSAAAVVGVLALTGGAIAWAGSHSNTVASPQANQSTTTTTATTTATTTTAAPTTTASTTTKATTTTQGSKTNADGVVVPPSTTSTAPLSYVTLYRYYNKTTGAHITAVAGTPVPGGFAKENYTIGKLLATSQPGTVKVYSCKETGNDYFTSTDQSGTCEGHGNTLMGLLGYIYKTPQGGDALTMYRCIYGSQKMHYDSIFANCDGNGTKEFVEGYQPK
ncbi:MAG TPA: serine/threonine-protein kinase [Pseudonocardiaceae bacterium]|nr:serine/threonine-protein kinase [Pseudonocardiaceae bacterium]